MKKKLSALALSCTLLLSLAACAGGRDSAETVVENGIEAFQSSDQEAIQSYWGDTDFTGDVGSSAGGSSSQDDDPSQALLEQLAGSLSYEITGSSEDESAGTASVTVSFTNTDMSQVMSEFMSDIFSTALGYAFLPEDQQPSDEEMNQIMMDSLMECMESNKENTVTNTVDISLSLVDDEWKITPTDEVIDAMVGGMFSYINSMDESFGGSESAPAAEPTRTNPADLGDYTVEIKDAAVTQDSDGNPAVVITYSWTNNSTETTSPASSLSTAVFQNGVGMESAFIWDESVYDSSAYTTDVRPGTTIDVQEAFALQDTASPIEVEISEWLSFDEPQNIAYMEFDLAAA